MLYPPSRIRTQLLAPLPSAKPLIVGTNEGHFGKVVLAKVHKPRTLPCKWRKRTPQHQSKINPSGADLYPDVATRQVREIVICCVCYPSVLSRPEAIWFNLYTRGTFELLECKMVNRKTNYDQNLGCQSIAKLAWFLLTTRPFPL